MFNRRVRRERREEILFIAKSKRFLPLRHLGHREEQDFRTLRRLRSLRRGFFIAKNKRIIVAKNKRIIIAKNKRIFSSWKFEVL